MQRRTRQKKWTRLGGPTRTSKTGGSFVRSSRAGKDSGREKKPACGVHGVLSAIVEYSEDAIISEDLGGHITTWNPAAERIFGYAAAEAIGQPASILVSAEHAAEQSATERRIYAGQHVPPYETIRVRKDGTPMEVSITASPIKDKEGRIVGMSKIVTDLTERKRLTGDLAALERLHTVAIRLAGHAELRSVLEEILQAAVEVTHAQKGTVQLYEPESQALRIVAARGFSEKWVTFYNEIRKASVATCGKALSCGERVIVEDVTTSPFFTGTAALDMQLAEGVRAVQSTPLVTRSGKVLGMLSTHFTAPHRPAQRDLHWLDLLARQAADLIERNISENTLQESEKRYKMLFNSIDEGFCVVEVVFDPANRPSDYRFLEINPAFEKQTGLKGAQGRLMRDLAPKHEQHWFDTFGRVALIGEPARFQNLAAELGRWYDVYAFRIGEPAARQVAVLFKDITEQKRGREELEQAVAERTAALRATIAELEGVSYSLSHDMRAPLRTIRSFTEIVLEQARENLAPQKQELLQKVINSAARLDRLIQDVLTYSRVARETISLQPINVEQLLRQIIDERPELQPPKARIEIQGPLPPVRGHEAYLTQCITNLLDNAVKFVAPGAQPQVRIWSEPVTERPPPNGPPPPRSVRLWFEDKGIGIPVEAQERIFEIFQRVHHDSKYPGTGIGLAIVRKAAERMGGAAGVKSELGRGSRFWLQLPRA